MIAKEPAAPVEHVSAKTGDEAAPLISLVNLTVASVPPNVSPVNTDARLLIVSRTCAGVEPALTPMFFAAPLTVIVILPVMAAPVCNR